MTVSTLSLSSLVVTDSAESRPLWEVWRCSVDVVTISGGGSRCAPSSLSWRWRGRRSSAPLFATIVWADPTHPPKRHLVHMRYNFFWISCFIVLVQLPRLLHACFLLYHYLPAPHVEYLGFVDWSNITYFLLVLEERPLQKLS